MLTLTLKEPSTIKNKIIPSYITDTKNTDNVKDNIITLRPPSFHVKNVEVWNKYLEENGFVVLRDILAPEEVSTSIDLFKRDWTYVSPNFDFDDPSTWTIQNCPMMFGKGMAVFNGFGQSDFMWYLRKNNTIKGVFADIFKTEDLMVSMDGFSVFVSDKQQSKPWLHIDENPYNQLYSIQGAYNFKKVGEDDAGLILVPRSHETFSPDTTHMKDWIMLNEKEVDMYKDNVVKLLLDENCLTLWNSRIIHANTGMTKKKRMLQEDINDLTINRLTCYIAYQPSCIRDEKTKKSRMDAYKNGDTTSHWANRCEIKTYPYGFKNTYEKRGFKRIEPTLDENGDIPKERLRLI
jgi:hypothetical protein